MILAYFYTYGYMVALLGLVYWAYNHHEDNRQSFIARIAFLVGIVSYLGGLVSADISASSKLFFGFRDLMILAAINWLLILVRPKKIVFWTFIVLGLVIFQAIGSSSMMHSLAGKTDGIVEVDKNGEWLVELEPHADFSTLRFRLKGLATLRRAFYPEDVNRTTLDSYYIVDVLDNSPESVAKVGRIIDSSFGVEWYEPNEVIQLSPSKGQGVKALAKDYGVDDPDTKEQWAMDALEMQDFYTFLRKQKPKVHKKGILAILDTGVDANHEDIKGHYISTESKSDNDPVGHGTHCAGIAGAVTNNGIGIASFDLTNKYYSVTSVKVLNASGMGTQASIIAGMIKATDNGATVISMSLGGVTGSRKQKAYEKAVKYANKNGAIVVVAAGNENRNATGVTPANVKGVIAVSAVDSTLSKALFSNYINDLDMGVAAPGVAIYSTIPDNEYASFNGTSMATPFVAGLVAIMKAHKPSLTTKEVYMILAKTGKITKNPKETGQFILPKKALESLK